MDNEIPKRVKDITGQRFERLVVRAFAGTRSNGSGRAAFWECICDCGNAVTIKSSSLIGGVTTSCGCKVKENNRGHKLTREELESTILGKQIGFVTVISLVSLPKPTQNVRLKSRWECTCSCGKSITLSGSAIFKNNTNPISCGCRSVSGGKTHGLSTTSEYRSWAQAKHRCYNFMHPGFFNYGGRGITMCERWRDSFENFLADMGPKPSPKHSVDRIDVNGNYEPGNCRWATAQEQTFNRRHSGKTVMIGVRYCDKKKRYRSGITVKSLGVREFKYFKTIEEAIAHRKQLEQTYINQD